MINSQASNTVSPVFKSQFSSSVGNKNQDFRSKEERTFPLAITIGIVIIIFLLIGLLSSVYLVRRQTNLSSRAYGSTSSSAEIELANSYIFASPLKALANGMDKIRVTVFVLDSQGKGVFGKAVTLGQGGPLSISPVQPTTDDLGRAIFDVSSSSTGIFFLEAQVGNKVLSQKVGLTFE